MADGVSATYQFLVDWNNDGDFSDSQEDITNDVKTVGWERGFDGPPPAYCAVGTLTIRLRNRTGKYNSENPESPLYGIDSNAIIHPGLLIQVNVNGATQFTGRIEEITTSSNNEVLEAGEAEIRALCPLGRLSEDGEINVPFWENITEADAIVQVLAPGVVDSDELDLIDSGQSTLTHWWLQNAQSRIQAIQELQDAGLGRFLSSKGGKYVYHDRGYIFESAGPRSTYGNGTLRMWEPATENPWPNIFNSFRGNVRCLNETEEMTLITVVDQVNGQGGRPIRILAGETKDVWVELNEKTNVNNILAVKSWSTVQPVINYVANTQEDGAGTNYTEWIGGPVKGQVPGKVDYGNRMKLTFTNTGVLTAYLVVLLAKGTGLVEGDPQSVKSDDGTVNPAVGSQGRYGKHEYPNPSNWMFDAADAQDMADYIVDVMAYPRPRIHYKIEANADADHMAEALALDIDDRIHIDDSGSGMRYGLYVDDDFIVDKIVHNVDFTTRPGGYHTVYVTCTKAPATELLATTTTRTPSVNSPVGPPDDLYINGIDPSGKVVIGIVARKRNSDVYEGELRAKFVTDTPEYVDFRTAAEGGTFAHNGTTQLIFGGPYGTETLTANATGLNKQWTSTSKGRWYYCGRLKNKQWGWSLWTDGNSKPVRVTHFVDTESGALADAGAPMSGFLGDSGYSGVNVEVNLSGGFADVSFVRPSINCNTILRACCQLRNANVPGAWHDYDDETSAGGPADVLYDGSGADHIFDKNALTLKSPTTFGSLTKGLVLLDVSNASTFDVQNCQWGYFDNNGVAVGDTISGLHFRPSGDPDTDQKWEHLRIKIVKPIWEWDEEGYLGAYPGAGIANLDFTVNGMQGDRSTQKFKFPSILLPDDLVMAPIEARVFVENKICVSEVGYSTETGDDSVRPGGDSDLQIITNDVDQNVPKGMMAFRWKRADNYAGIYCAAFWVSSALPGQGPFDAERTAFPATVLEQGTCVVTQGSNVISIAGRSDQNRDLMVLMFYTDDADPDDDLNGDYIKEDNGAEIVLGEGFGMRNSGTFSYAIIKPWYFPEMSSNLAYHQFSVPDEIGGDASLDTWQTSRPVPMPNGAFFVTGCTKNSLGLGDRMTASSADIGTGAGARCVVLTDVNPLIINTKLIGAYGEKLLVWSVDGDRTLDPPINSQCGDTIRLRIINTSGSEVKITLDSIFRVGRAFPTYMEDSITKGLPITESE